MKTYFKEVMVHTQSRVTLLDITPCIEEGVNKSGIKQGICLIYLPHSTAAIVVNEHESGLMQDILVEVEKLFPSGIDWLHDRVDDNARAHLASIMLGQSRTFPIVDGHLVRGQWQNIFLLELDGPRSRRVVIQTLGE
jgi:secondary thiamine-phosphate synthase enzyme